MDADAEVPPVAQTPGSPHAPVPRALPVAPVPAVEVTAFQQGGVVTRRQALEMGMTPPEVRRMVGSGRWRALARGVYAVDVPVWHQVMWAGLLVAGEGACVGGRAAAHLYGLEGPPPQIDIWVLPGRSVPRRREMVGGREMVTPGGHGQWVSWRFRQGSRTAVGNPPRSCVEETVLDICQEKLHRHFREEGEQENPFWFLRSYPPIVRGRIRSVLGPAIDSGLTTAEKLHAVLDKATNLEGGALVGWEIDEMEAGRRIGGRRTRGLRRRDPRGRPHPPTD